MRLTYSELLEAALRADKSPEFDAPSVRQGAPTRKLLGYDAKRYRAWPGEDRTWKRFRATQYRVA